MSDRAVKLRLFKFLILDIEAGTTSAPLLPLFKIIVSKDSSSLNSFGKTPKPVEVESNFKLVKYLISLEKNNLKITNSVTFPSIAVTPGQLLMSSAVKSQLGLCASGVLL